MSADFDTFDLDLKFEDSTDTSKTFPVTTISSITNDKFKPIHEADSLLKPDSIRISQNPSQKASSATFDKTVDKHNKNDKSGMFRHKSDDDNRIKPIDNASFFISKNNKEFIPLSESERPITKRIRYVNKISEKSKIPPFINYNNFDTEIANKAELRKSYKPIKDFIEEHNAHLRYIRSGTTGHTFKVVSNKTKQNLFAMKVTAYPKKSYGRRQDLGRPENVELRMVKLLARFVKDKKTPHLVLPFTAFDTSIKEFVTSSINLIDFENKDRHVTYKKFLKKIKKGRFDTIVSVLVVEIADFGDLLDYVKRNYKNMDSRCWKVIFFQLLLTLAKIQETYPSFRHNDLKPNNILVCGTKINAENIEKKYNEQAVYVYNFDDFYFKVPHIGISINIWDFDFASIENIIENNKVNSKWANEYNISKNKNRYYDINYFFNTLISERFFPEFFKPGAVPDDIKEFIMRVLPEPYRNGGKYVNTEKNRIISNFEYTTPFKLLSTDPIFSEFRILSSNNMSLSKYVLSKYEMFNVASWKIIFFQLILNLSLIHEHYYNYKTGVLINDNIIVRLIEINSTNMEHNFEVDEQKFIIPNFGIQIKVWNFDCLCFANNDNPADCSNNDEYPVITNDEKNNDLKCFFKYLVKSKKILKKYVPEEIYNFIKLILIDKTCTPYSLLMSHELFNIYRI
jgi:hypothetical protein